MEKLFLIFVRKEVKKMTQSAYLVLAEDREDALKGFKEIYFNENSKILFVKNVTDDTTDLLFNDILYSSLYQYIYFDKDCNRWIKKHFKYANQKILNYVDKTVRNTNVLIYDLDDFNDDNIITFCKMNIFYNDCIRFGKGSVKYYHKSANDVVRFISSSYPAEMKPDDNNILFINSKDITVSGLEKIKSKIKTAALSEYDLNRMSVYIFDTDSGYKYELKLNRNGLILKQLIVNVV